MKIIFKNKKRIKNKNFQNMSTLGSSRYDTVELLFVKYTISLVLVKYNLHHEAYNHM